MIKTFEQFVSDRYSKPVNEGFQSNTLRQIIKQHGLPKNDWDKKMLYDLKDNEIVDVVDSREEYDKKYNSVRRINKDEETFMIELEDGYCVVISNLGILQDLWSQRKGMMKDVVLKRYKERRKGNLGKDGGDDIHKKHLEKVNDLENERFTEKMYPYLPEIAEEVKSYMEEMAVGMEDGTHSDEFEITLDNNEYTVEVNFEIELKGRGRRYGAYYHDVVYTIESIIISNGDAYASFSEYSVEDAEIFKPHTIEDVEGEIYDKYAYYGVSRGDFY